MDAWASPCGPPPDVGGYGSWSLSLSLAGVGWLLLAACLGAAPAPPLRPVVEIEEDVYRYTAADNGAGPMWCHGSTCLVRTRETVFASGLETLAGLKPLNNCRWMLLRRGTTGWETISVDDLGRTREPCPLAAFPDGRLFLSANPTLAPTNQPGGGPARPEIWQFDVGTLLAGEAARPLTPSLSPGGGEGARRAGQGSNQPSARARTDPGPVRLLPQWQGNPDFTEHSYRSLAADGPNRELILFQNIGYTHAEWAFRDRAGQWTAQGRLVWPWGADYAKPQPIRVCYPNVALVGRAVHFCGVSDILEPNPAWRAFKKQITGREWDYDFRRLFYTWTPDIVTGKFADWIEIASRETTGGWITPGDLWVGPDGAVHLLWTERALDERLREQFFPAARQSHALNYAQVRRGQVTFRRTLALAEEGGSQEIPGRGRFHATPDGRLVVCYYVSGRDAAGRALSENRLVELHRDGGPGEPVRVPLRHPITEFFTATERAGSPPSNTLELLGQRAGSPLTVSYARMRLR